VRSRYATDLSTPARRTLRTALWLALTCAAGCTGTTGHLAVVSTRHDIPAAALLTVAPARHVIGRSCIDLVVVFPIGLPNFGAAIADALRQGNGQVLTDASIRYEVRYLPLIYGIACYVAEGDVR
jgi:hypothetical protein